MGDDLHVHDGAVLALMPGERRLLPMAPLEPRTGQRDTSSGAEVHHGHAQELLPAEAVVPDRRVVDGEEDQRVHVEDPHRLGVGVEQQTVPAVGLDRLAMEPAGVDRQRGPLAQLHREAEILLLEAAPRLPRGHQGQHPRLPACPQRDPDVPGRRQRPVHLELLRIGRPLAQQLVGHFDQGGLGPGVEAEGQPAVAVLAQDADREIARGVAVRPGDEAQGAVRPGDVSRAPVGQGGTMIRVSSRSVTS